jgi:cystathionine beta-lyase/cystathionine gamma-synthase
MRDMLPRWVSSVRLLIRPKSQDFAAAVRPNTKLNYVESPTNPLRQLTDLKAVAELARGCGITVTVPQITSTSY